MSWTPLPVGVENFKEIIEKGYYYVDKTLMIRGRPQLPFFRDKDHERGRTVSERDGAIPGDLNIIKINETGQFRRCISVFERRNCERI